MIEKEAADPGTLRPHASPFLGLDLWNFLALTLSMMVGTASLPHLLMRPLTAPTVREARLSVAWAGFFVLIIATAVPAIAAFAKLEVYGLIAKGTAFADLPAWMEGASRQDLVRFNGVSLRLLEETIGAVRSGAADVNAVTAHLKLHALEAGNVFAGLAEPVQAALVEAARSSQELAEPGRWTAFKGTVLPAAARAAGSASGLLTESGLRIDPAAVTLLLPEIAGQPKIITALVAAGALAAALATATGVLLSISYALGHDLYAGLVDRKAPPGRRLAVTRLMLLVVAAGAAYASLVRPADFMTVVAWAFSLAAAGLFPAMVLGIWWKRANAWGATAGMVAGFGVALYYMAGTQFFPVAFYDLWSGLVPTSEIVLERMSELRRLWESAAGDAKPAAWAAFEAALRGSPNEAGAASWLGVPNVSAAIFALPLGFLLVILVSLLTPRPWPETIALIDEMRVPKGPEILEQEVI